MRITRTLLPILLVVASHGEAQPGVFTVGVVEPPMQVLLIGDTIEAPWQGLDTYTFDADADSDVDLLLLSRHYLGGLGSGRSLEVQCSDSTTLAIGSAVDQIDMVLGGPVTVEVPQLFALGEQTSGAESYSTPVFFNHYAYQNFPGAVAADLHAWNTVVDGFLVFKKVVLGVSNYGWIRLETYGLQSSFAVVKEIGFQALTTGAAESDMRGSALVRTRDGFLVDSDAGSHLSILDASGRFVHSEHMHASGPTMVTLPKLGEGLYQAVLRTRTGVRVEKFMVVGH